MPSADTKPTKSSAWARLFARMIDLPIASLIALPFLASVDAASSANFERVLGPAVGGFVKVGLQFAVFSVILISYESILLRMFGTTAGKAILGLRMQVQDARPIDWATAWRRTASAWMRGSWAYFMFPIVTLLVWWRVYMALQKEGVTSWDQRFNTRVLGDPGPMRRTIGGSIAAIGFVTVILLLVVGGQMERNQRKQIARDTFERSRSPTLTKGVTFPSLRSPSTEHQHLTLARQLAGKWFCLAMNFTNEYSREGVIEEYRPNGTQADGQERWYIDGDGRLNEANLFAQNGSNPGYFVWRIEWETPGQRFVKTNVDSGAQLGCERRH